MNLKVPSLKTVAEAVGVSTTTVSNAYNRPEHLSTEVRERIFRVARELGYAGPHPVARSLRRGRSGAIGMLLTFQLSHAFRDPYCVQLLTGVSEVAERSRTGLLLIPVVPTLGATAEEIRASVQAASDALVDGVIADGMDGDHPALRAFADRGVPIVRTLDEPGVRCVLIDERAAGYQIGQHLAGLGHRQVTVVVDYAGPPERGLAGPDEHDLYPYVRLRLAGIRDGLGAGARISLIGAGRSSVASGRGAAEVLLRHRRPSAVACTSDVLALGVLEVLGERGIAAGSAVSVTGFDDIPAAAAAGLTTIRQPIREKGQLLGRMLLDPGYPDRRVELTTQLVVRASTGPRER